MKLKFRAETKDVIIFIIFAIFLFYLVAIVVVNLHTVSTEQRLSGLNPILAFSPSLILPTICFYFLSLIALCMGVSSYFFEREKGFGLVHGKKKETGYTRWATEKEIEKDAFVEKVMLNEDAIEKGGFPLILKKDYAWIDTDDTHSLIIGSTGSGKTECFILPTIKILAKAGESIVVTDPKGEIYKKTAGLLKSKGYKIILLNFREPQRGNSWNPFSLPYRYYKNGNKDKSTELIEDLANNVIKDEGSKADPFWQDAASDYFTGLTLGLFEDAEENQTNFNSINLMETLGNENIPRSNMKYIQKYFKDKGELSPEYVAASTTINAPSDTKASIISSFRQKIKIFSTRDSLSEMLSESDFDYDTIGTEKTAVFIVIHDEKKTYHALATIFVKQAYEALVNVAQNSPGGKLPIRTNFLLDEFSNMPALTDVDAMVSAARSRSIRFGFIIQNYSQLNKTYGENIAETIKGNCTNTYFLSTSELKALEEFSKLCGESKPKKNKDKPDDPIRPLVTVSDLQQLDKFQFVIKRLRIQPFKTKFAADFEINKVDGWGEKYDEAQYPSRNPHEIKVFNIKDYVNAKNEQEIGAGFNLENDFMNMRSPLQSEKSLSLGPAGIPDMDEFLKNIDETIAKLEEEERKEKEKLENQKQKKKEEIIEKNSISESNALGELKEEKEIVSERSNNKENFIDNNIEITPEVQPKTEENDILDNIITNNITESKEEKIDSDNVNVLEEEQNNISNTQINNNQEESDIPKVNVDKDSIIVDEHITDDQFFDDFFGDDD